MAIALLLGSGVGVAILWLAINSECPFVSIVQVEYCPPPKKDQNLIMKYFCVNYLLNEDSEKSNRICAI
jgi:hypothetical protein